MADTEPLLAADPPIDDDSFQYEAQSFPSDIQKHVVYMCSALSISMVQLLDMVATSSIVVLYQRSLVAVTLWTLTRSMLASKSDGWAGSILRTRRSRLFVVVCALLAQGVAAMASTSALATATAYPFLILSLAAYCAQRIAFQVFQTSFQLDWCRIITNDQAVPYAAFVRRMHLMMVTCQLIMPILGSLAVEYFGAYASLSLLRFTLALATLIEIGLVYQLYNTCYALRLPRVPETDAEAASAAAAAAAAATSGPTSPEATTSAAADGTRAKGILWRRPPVKRILRYIKRRPLPVAATVGMILVRTSLLTIGPQMVWFLYVQGSVPLTVLGVLRSSQSLLAHLVTSLVSTGEWIDPGIIAWGAGPWLIVINAAAAALVWVHPGMTLAIVALAARVGVPALDLFTQALVQTLVADHEVLKLYREAETALQGSWDFVMHSMTLVWSSPQGFRWPVAISAALTLAGVVTILGVGRHAR